MAYICRCYSYSMFRHSLLVMAVLVMVGCGATTAPTTQPVRPEHQAVTVALQVVAAADPVVTGIDQAMQAGTLPTRIGIPVLQAIREVGVQAQTLATAVKLAAAARTVQDQATYMGKAQAALAAMNDLLKGAVPTGTPATITAVLDGLLGPLRDTVRRVQDAITPKGQDHDAEDAVRAGHGRTGERSAGLGADDPGHLQGGPDSVEAGEPRPGGRPLPDRHPAG